MTKKTPPKKSPKTPGSPPIAKQPEALRRIAGELRELSKVVKEAPPAPGLGKILNKAFRKGGRLLLEAARAGAFHGDAKMAKLVEEFWEWVSRSPGIPRRLDGHLPALARFRRSRLDRTFWSVSARRVASA